MSLHLELIEVIEDGDFEGFEQLLEMSAVVDIAHENNNDALITAIALGETDMAAELLGLEKVEATAHVNENEALLEAIRQNNTTIVTFLLDIPEVKKLALDNPDILLHVVESHDIAVLNVFLGIPDFQVKAHLNDNELLDHTLSKNNTNAANRLCQMPQVIDGLENYLACLNLDTEMEIIDKLFELPVIKQDFVNIMNKIINQLASKEPSKELLLAKLVEITYNNLIKAIRAKDTAETDALISLGVLQYLIAVNNNAILHELLDNNNLSLANHVLQNPNVIDGLYEYVSSLALEGNDEILLKLFSLDHFKEHAQDLLENFLIQAMKNDELDIFANLIQLEPIQAMLNKNPNILRKALIEEKYEYSRRLLRLPVLQKHGSMLNNIALMQACRFGTIEEVKNILLMPNVIDNTKITDTGATPLHLAAVQDNLELFEIFLDAGYDINEADYSGNTPLHVAAMFNSTNILNRLLELEADKHAKNNKGLDALSLAITNKQPDAQGILIAAGLDEKRSRAVLEANAPINQGKILENLAKWLYLTEDIEQHATIKDVIFDLMSKGGYCNGFSWLHKFLGPHEYDRVMHRITAWNGDIDTLDTDLNQIIKIALPIIVFGQQYPDLGERIGLSDDDNMITYDQYAEQIGQLISSEAKPLIRTYLDDDFIEWDLNAFTEFVSKHVNDNTKVSIGGLIEIGNDPMMGQNFGGHAIDFGTFHENGKQHFWFMDPNAKEGRRVFNNLKSCFNALVTDIYRYPEGTRSLKLKIGIYEEAAFTFQEEKQYSNKAILETGLQALLVDALDLEHKIECITETGDFIYISLQYGKFKLEDSSESKPQFFDSVDDLLATLAQNHPNIEQHVEELVVYKAELPKHITTEKLDESFLSNIKLETFEVIDYFIENALVSENTLFKAISDAIKSNNDYLLERLLSHQNLDLNKPMKDESGKELSLLSFAVENNNPKAVKVLMAAGADPATKYSNPFLVGLELDNIECVKQLFASAPAKQKKQMLSSKPKDGQHLISLCSSPKMKTFVLTQQKKYKPQVKKPLAISFGIERAQSEQLVRAKRTKRPLTDKSGKSLATIRRHKSMKGG